MVELDELRVIEGALVAAREFDCEITQVELVMGDAVLLTMTAPEAVVTQLRAGQFVDVLCRLPGSYDPLLRRPYSVYRVDTATSTITLLVRPFGRGSAWLASRSVGTILDLLGPLGNRFEIAPRSRNLLLVAGGVGAAPLVMLAHDAVRRGLNVTYLMGAANESGLLPAAELPAVVEYLAATDDGTMGHHGFVTELVTDFLVWADQLFACGPEAMFLSLRRIVLANRLGSKPTVQVSVEREMACGLGACLGCVVESRSGMQTSCVRGPIYDMEDVIWE
ncbi:MAG: dihydroorotate dehydrogenase electron transfer subunit [Chloroflexota bacterium]|nr:dihydroorotate dehydrogenase electron transfer subunit [Chloroflexota bacterium]